MRAKISKKLRKFAFASTIGDGWTNAKQLDAVTKENVRRLESGKIVCTYTRDRNAPRRYYRRMKKLWSSLSIDQKRDVLSRGLQHNIVNG